jgi:hypothetical protein
MLMSLICNGSSAAALCFGKKLVDVDYKNFWEFEIFMVSFSFYLGIFLDPGFLHLSSSF